MSFGARLTLAIASGLIAIAFSAVALTIGPRLPLGSWPFYLLTVFCLSISVACLSPVSRPITLRLIGSVVFLATAAFVYSERNSNEWVGTILAFAVFGLPAGYVAVTGRYPSWGEHAAAFEGDSDGDEFE
jgi:hypothetical protein